MKPLPSFLIVALASFGATHLALAARGKAEPRLAAERPVPPAPVPSAPPPPPAIEPACRQVRVVYAGSVRPPGEPCVRP